MSNHRVAPPVSPSVGLRGPKGDVGSQGPPGPPGPEGPRSDKEGPPGAAFPMLQRLAVTANGSVGSLDPDAVLLHAIFREKSERDVLVTLGRRNAVSDILPPTKIPGGGVVSLPLSMWLPRNGQPHDIWINSPAWNGACVNVTLLYLKAP